MHVDLYERIWIWAAALMIAAFLGAVIFSAGSHAVHPPSHVETVDPTKVLTEGEFTRPGVTRKEDGSVLVTGISRMFVFTPGIMKVPVGVPVTFRLTSPDVVHGFQVVGTNANTMVIPGYVSQFTVTFDRPGEYLVLCNEYCGLSHHLMQGKLIVEDGQ